MRSYPLFFLASLCAAVLPQHYPSLVLFAKMNDTWVPLRAKRDILFTYFSISSMTTPIAEFGVEKGYIAMVHPVLPRYIGFYMGRFVLGPDFVRTRLSVDKDGLITNQAFYNCQKKTRDVIMKEPGEKCVKLDVYVMPYSRKTKAPMKITTENFVKNLLLESEQTMDPGTEKIEASN